MGFVDLLIYLKICIKSFLFARNKIAYWSDNGDKTYMVSCDELEHPEPRIRHPITYIAIEPELSQPGFLDCVWPGEGKRSIYNC